MSWFMAGTSRASTLVPCAILPGLPCGRQSGRRQFEAPPVDDGGDVFEVAVVKQVRHPVRSSASSMATRRSQNAATGAVTTSYQPGLLWPQRLLHLAQPLHHAVFLHLVFHAELGEESPQLFQPGADLVDTRLRPVLLDGKGGRRLRAVEDDE